MSISILKNIFQCKWAFLNENFSGIVSKSLNSWSYQPQRISSGQILFCAAIWKTELTWTYAHLFPHSLSSFSTILADFISFVYSACFIVLVLSGFVGAIFLLVLFWCLPGQPFADQATFLTPKPLFDSHCSSPVGAVPSAFTLTCDGQPFQLTWAWPSFDMESPTSQESLLFMNKVSKAWGNAYGRGRGVKYKDI